MFRRRGIGLNNPGTIMVFFLIIGPVLLIWGIAGYFMTSRTTGKYTVTYGVVTAVEMHRETNYHTVETSYVATVKPEDGSIFETSYLTSGKTGYEYEEGEHVEITYDPSDPSIYYIQHADPKNGYINMIIVGAIVLFIGTGIFLVRKL